MAFLTCLSRLLRRRKPLSLIINADAINEQKPEGFVDTSRGRVTWKTLISAPKTATDTFSVGIATCPPKTGQLCRHRHKQAEVYHITEGIGIIQIDGIEKEVRTGHVIYIPGNAKHGIRNEDPELDLVWLYVFAVDAFEDVKYRF